MEKLILSEISPQALAYSLLGSHSNNYIFRHEDDLNETKHHVYQTLDWIMAFLKNCDDSTEDKIKFLEETIDEIPKFHGKHKN